MERMRHVTHPGGFKKITLASLFGVRFRVHVWRDFTGDLEDPHRHRWLLISLPLWGRFHDYRWEEVEGDQYEVFSATPYSTSTRSNHYETNLTYERGTGLRCVDVLSRLPFIPYHCKTGEIHSYRPVGQGLHMSLVLTTRADQSVGYVYRRKDDVYTV